MTSFINLCEISVHNLVFLTAITSDHYGEVMDAIGSVQKWLPKNRIIIYDIQKEGLAKDHIVNVSNK